MDNEHREWRKNEDVARIPHETFEEYLRRGSTTESAGLNILKKDT